MKLRTVLVTGSRDWKDHEKVKDDIIQQRHEAISEGTTLLIVEGGALGADRIARDVCKHFGIHYAEVPAMWNEFGKRGGPLRNEVMAAMFEYDAILAYPLPQSKGTYHMMKIARVKDEERGLSRPKVLE